MYKYSASTGGFYLHEIHGAATPADCVDLSDREHAELMTGQMSGRRIVPDIDGRPVLVDPLPPTSQQLWVAQQLRAQRALAASDITMLRCIERGIDVPADWVTYRSALRAIASAASGDPAQVLPQRPAYPPGT